MLGKYFERPFLSSLVGRASSRTGLSARWLSLLVIAHDFLMAGLSLYLACLLRLDMVSIEHTGGFLLYGPPTFALLAGAVFFSSGLHRGLWRHTSTGDLLAIARASTIAILVSLPVLFQLDRLEAMPRSVPMIQWLLLNLMLGGPRMAWRLLEHRGFHLALPARRNCAQPILLVGTGEGCALFIRMASSDRESPYFPVGILTLVRHDIGRRIHGVPILGHVDGLFAVVAAVAAAGTQPGRLIVTEKLDGLLLRRIVAQAEKIGLATARLPSLVELKAAIDEGRIELKPIALNELLGRPQVRLDRAAIGRLIAGRRVLVTGAGGTIGSELTRQIAACRPAHLILLDVSEFNAYTIDRELGARFAEVSRTMLIGDIRDRERILHLFEELRPELVFHAAALKHVPIVEANPIEGVLTNVVGTLNVADASSTTSSVLAMVQISTDKAVNPTSVMGATKRLAELYCQALDTAAGADVQAQPRFITVRFGNVLGSSGSVVPMFQQQLAVGGPLTVTHPDTNRYFMTTSEASELVLQVSAFGVARDLQRGIVCVLDMGVPIRIVDLARQMIRLAGKEPDTDVAISFTGLRPGEKLYEELFDREELRMPIDIPSVLAARSRPMNLTALRWGIAEIAEACSRQDEMAMWAILHRIVPGYGGSSIADSNAAGRHPFPA